MFGGNYFGSPYLGQHYALGGAVVAPDLQDIASLLFPAVPIRSPVLEQVALRGPQAVLGDALLDRIARLESVQEQMLREDWPIKLLFNVEWLRWFNTLRQQMATTLSVSLTLPFSLGGSDTSSVPMAAPPAYAPCWNVHYFIAGGDFDCVARVWIWARNSGVQTRARLYDLTSSAAVGSSGWVTATERPTNPEVFEVSMTVGHTYRLELITNTASESCYGIGDLYAS
jgi:hypothetical protein